MKVLLIKDVYKLGHAGDVKRVADGYGRNYLLPHNLAVLATPGALKQAERIRQQASVQRAALNKEMGVVAEKIEGLTLTFPARASETGKLYGSITNQMIAEAISQKAGIQIERRQIDTQPLRALGEHVVHVRLTVDLIPTISVIVHREGESPRGAQEAVEQPAAGQPVAEQPVAGQTIAEEPAAEPPAEPEAAPVTEEEAAAPSAEEAE